MWWQQQLIRTMKNKKEFGHRKNVQKSSFNSFYPASPFLFSSFPIFNSQQWNGYSTLQLYTYYEPCFQWIFVVRILSNTHDIRTIPEKCVQLTASSEMATTDTASNYLHFSTLTANESRKIRKTTKKKNFGKKESENTLFKYEELNERRMYFHIRFGCAICALIYESNFYVFIFLFHFWQKKKKFFFLHSAVDFSKETNTMPQIINTSYGSSSRILAPLTVCMEWQDD